MGIVVRFRGILEGQIVFRKDICLYYRTYKGGKCMKGSTKGLLATFGCFLGLLAIIDAEKKEKEQKELTEQQRDNFIKQGSKVIDANFREDSNTWK